MKPEHLGTEDVFLWLLRCVSAAGWDGGKAERAARKPERESLFLLLTSAETVGSFSEKAFSPVK